MMKNRNKLKKLLEVFDPSSGTSVDFKEFDDSIKVLKDALTEKIQAQTIDDVQGQLDKFKKKFDINPILKAAQNLEQALDLKIEGISGQLRAEVGELQRLLTNQEENTHDQISTAASSIESLKRGLSGLIEQKNTEVKDIKDKLSKLLDFDLSTQNSFIKIEKDLDDVRSGKKLGDEQVKELSENLEATKKDFLKRLSSIHFPGHANRNIAIGGNTSVLGRYTDINIKPGSNVTFSYINNDVTKYLDLTISATGGGGSVGGVVRSINRVSTSQTMGADAGTDYVYIATAGVRLELPTAVGNTNLYTIKNVSVSSVLIATTGGETIDTDTNLILATQFTAVDLVNDGNDDWGIT